MVIGDRSYRIKIDPADEETVRKTLRVINDKILEYKTQFAGKGMQDYIAMVLLWYATQAATRGQEGSTGDSGGSDLVTQALVRVEQLLDKAILI